MMTTIDDDEIKEGRKKKIRVERWRSGGGGKGKLQPNGVKEV